MTLQPPSILHSNKFLTICWNLGIDTEVIPCIESFLVAVRGSDITAFLAVKHHLREPR